MSKLFLLVKLDRKLAFFTNLLVKILRKLAVFRNLLVKFKFGKKLTNEFSQFFENVYNFGNFTMSKHQFPCIRLDYDDVARRIDAFIENGSLFRLFEPDDVLEILKRSNLNPEIFTTFAKYLQIYYDERTIIKILTQLPIISTNISKQNFNIIKNSLELLEIPVLSKIFSLINSRKKLSLSLSNSLYHESYIITFGENSSKLDKLESKDLDELDMFIFLRFIHTDIEKAEYGMKSYDDSILIALLSYCIIGHLRYTANLFFEIVRKYKRNIDEFTLCTLIFSLGDIDCIRILIENGIEVNNHFDCAIFSGHINIVKFFLRELISEKTFKAQRQKFCEIAVENEQFHILEFLNGDELNLNKEDDVPMKVNDKVKNLKLLPGWLWIIAWNLDDMDFLKEHTFNSASETVKFIKLILQTQNYKLLDNILQNENIKMILTQHDKEKLLKNASVYGCIEVIEVVFKHLFDPNVYNYHHVLKYITYYNKPSIILQLRSRINFTAYEFDFFNFIEPKMKEIIRDSNKASPSFHHIPVGCLKEILDVDYNYIRALGRPVKHNIEVDYLYQCAADMDISNSAFKSEHISVANDIDPLMLSCRCDSIENVKILIDKGFDVNEMNIAGYRPIHVACKYGNLKVVELLYDNGCDVTIKNSQGHNGIDYAVVGGYPEIIEFLSQRGARIDKDLCIEHGHYMALKYLINEHIIIKTDSIVKKIHDCHREEIFKLLGFI